MSSANLIIGIPLNTVLKKQEAKETVTRYDEKTGKPYQKEEKESYWTLFGKRIEPDEDPDMCPEECLDRSMGLHVYTNGAERSGDRECLLGVSVGEVGDCNSSRTDNLQTISIETILQTTQETIKKFRAQGYEGLVGLHLLMYESF